MSLAECLAVWRMPLLDQSFWARFAKTTWEKKSVAIQNIRSPLLELDHAAVFRLLVSDSDRCRRFKNADGMKLYIEGHRQLDSETLRHLPKKSDKNFSGYHERMSSQYADYCLVADELLRVNHSYQEHLEGFAALLFANVGLPNRFTEMGLYLGNYRKTPFGVHEDPCGVFSFPVVGRKKFRIWKPDFVKRNPKLAHAVSYAKFKSGSQTLNAGVGDMTYWPSSAWHIAESDGSFSATWSLGVWVDKKQSDAFGEVTKDLLTKALGDLGDRRMTEVSNPTSQGEIESLPATYRRSLASFRSLSVREMTSALRESWMAHSSKRGFKNSPEHDLKLRALSLVRLKSTRRPILWMKDGREKIYAFDGITVRSSSKSLFRFVTAVNQGKEMRAARDVTRLQPLARAGAFRLSKTT